MRIAVDAMGGDNAPKAIVEGVMLAKKAFQRLNSSFTEKKMKSKNT